MRTSVNAPFSSYEVDILYPRGAALPVIGYFLMGGSSYERGHYYVAGHLNGGKWLVVAEDSSLHSSRLKVLAFIP